MEECSPGIRIGSERIVGHLELTKPRFNGMDRDKSGIRSKISS
jgi:hypothetical protein